MTYLQVEKPITSFIEKYYGKRIEIKTVWGETLQGRVGYFAEDTDTNAERPDEKFDGWGFEFKDVIKDGIPVPSFFWSDIGFADIVSYLPLEVENTPEEIDALPFR